MMESLQCSEGKMHLRAPSLNNLIIAAVLRKQGKNLTLKTSSASGSSPAHHRLFLALEL